MEKVRFFVLFLLLAAFTAVAPLCARAGDEGRAEYLESVRLPPVVLQAKARAFEQTAVSVTLRVEPAKVKDVRAKQAQLEEAFRKDLAAALDPGASMMQGKTVNFGEARRRMLQSATDILGQRAVHDIQLQVTQGRI